MGERIRDGFTFSLPVKVIEQIDSERGLITRSAYLSNILVKIYNIKEEEIPHPSRKIAVQGLSMVTKVAPTGVGIQPNG